MLRNSLALLFLASFSIIAAAQKSPAGLCRTIDDKTGKPQSIVRIAEKDGVYSGFADTILNLEKRDGVCEECDGERKDQPIQGMTILWDLEKSGNKWTNGEILDPNNGKIYSAYLKLKNEGQALEVRGFIGISLLGRSQTWQRGE